MLCPKDGSNLKEQQHHGIKVDICSDCGGIWLDQGELDSFEDIKFDKDLDKGSLIIDPAESDLLCPICSENLYTFKYRFHTLHLEACHNQHGFWLDADEDQEVMNLMGDRKMAIKRKVKLDRKWQHIMDYLENPTFFNRLRLSILEN